MSDVKEDEIYASGQPQKNSQNSEYLKKYVEAHPNNQMAWYLLGREYTAKEEKGKAEFCFNKAGEVYKVFEEIPSVEFDQPELRHAALLQSQKPIRKSRLKRKVFIITLILLFLIYIPVQSPTIENVEIETDSTQVITKPVVKPSSVVTNMENTQVIYMKGSYDEGGLENALAYMILLSSRYFNTSILVQASTLKDGRWVNWLEPPKMLLSARRNLNGDKLNIEYYDVQSCICIPGSDAKAVEEFEQWQEEQEQKMVLSSALYNYQLLNGALPESIEELTQNYPGNVLSGSTPRMKKWSDKWLSDAANKQYEMKQSGINQPGINRLNPSETNSNVNSPLEELDPIDFENAIIDLADVNEQLQKPLEIIVDKQNHRLALVSGDVVIRNYPVGLGGDKTPEGEFVISEKVKDPNGSPDGDFGSRGMTLSDTLYAIHGTDEPDSIGKDQSLGCIRMLREDVEELFDMIPKGSKVTILSGGLPEEIIRSEKAFSLPSNANETNPDKVYNWLN